MIHIEGKINDIDLQFVDGCYRDRAKMGYWIRSIKDNKTTKTYHDDLTRQQINAILAACHFNQRIRSYL